MTTQSQEEFIVNNMNIVKNIASKYYTDKIGLDYEDLVSYGVMGLIDARKKLLIVIRKIKIVNFQLMLQSEYLHL